MVKTRSPNYPVISLAEAIDKVRKIYKAEHLHSASDEVIAKALNYTSLNGRSMGVISAIKKYGLLTPEGDGYRVSDDAVNIIELPTDDPDHVKALKKVAFMPQLFSELHETYGDQLPSDSNLRHYLIKKKFNPNATDEIIKLYRDTTELVTGLTSEYDSGDSDGINNQEDKPLMQQPPPSSTGQSSREVHNVVSHNRPGTPGPTPPLGMHFPLYLSQEKQGALYVPSVLSKKEWKLLKIQITNSLAIAEATALIEDEEPTKAEPEQPKERDEVDKAFGVE